MRFPGRRLEPAIVRFGECHLERAERRAKVVEQIRMRQVFFLSSHCALQ
jgi:hypothetical protein